MRAPEQLRCPYTLKALSDLPDTSREHIVPDAIGGPDSYSVSATNAENAWFGTNIDAPLVDAHFVRLARLLLSIKGRSGVPELRLSGTTQPHARPIRLTIAPDGSHRYEYVKPFELDEATGRGHLITNPKVAEKEMKRLTERYAKEEQAG